MANTSSSVVGASAAAARSARRRQQRALRVMIIVLIPLAVWTVAGLLALWPHDVASHVDSEVANGVPGVSYPTGRITNVAPISCEGVSGSTTGAANQTCANLSVQLLDGPDSGKTVVVAITDAAYGSGVAIGQQVKLTRTPPTEGQPAQYQFSDFERRAPLLALTVIFAGVVVLVARWRGFAALLGLAFAGFILVAFVFPALITGTNPILVGLFGSSAILFVALYATHGFSTRTTTALLGSLLALGLTALLSWAATRWAHLTGITSEDDFVLAASAPSLTLTSVVICGIILAGLGVLVDVTMTQSSAVWELADAEPGTRHLFARALQTGREHTASAVYTVGFATVGILLPVLLLTAVYKRPVVDVLQTEQFADALVRTLVATIGLVLAVPLTTVVGVAVFRASAERTVRRSRAKAKAREDAVVADEEATVVRSRRRRRDEFEDIDDFSDLREPVDEPHSRRP